MLRVTKSMVTWLVAKGICTPDGSADFYRHNISAALVDGSLPHDELLTMSRDETYDDSPAARKEFFKKDEKEMSGTTPEKLFSGRGNIVVKDATSQYCIKRATARNKHGHEVLNPYTGKPVETMSERSKVEAGVLFKHCANRAGLGIVLTDHEREILADMAQNKAWCGTVNGEHHDEIKGVKALIDDQTSGGLEIVPIHFDSDIITFPLLNSELLPFTDLVQIPRGRRVESGSISNVTVSWGGGDDTSITPFSTAGMVQPLDTTIFTVDAAIVIGKDFLSDSPVKVGEKLTETLGMRFANELDKVVAMGNSTTQPQGLTQASGLTTISASGGTSGPPTLSDYLNLMFSVGKQYRNPAWNPTFVSNDTTFQRSRGIKIGADSPSSDQRPVLDPSMANQGAFVNQYSTLGWRHAICNDLPNGTCFFSCLKKFRMYRRLGMEIQFYKDGYTLGRANEVLLVARARYGGRLMDSNAAAKWLNGQS